MNANTSIIQRYSLALFLILTPLISLLVALFLPLPVESIVLILLLIPSGLAILFAALAEGGKGVTALFKKLIQWRVSIKWYLVAIGLPVVIMLTAGVLAYLLGWSDSFQIRTPPSSQLVFNAILILFVAVLEELGWRGYALPRLLTNRSPLASALIIGVPWGLLHIGIGLLDGRPWLPTFLSPLILSVTITWLFVQTRGSLAMAILFHYFMDFCPQFVLSQLPIDLAIWSQVIVTLVVALVLVLFLGSSLLRTPVHKPAAADIG